MFHIYFIYHWRQPAQRWVFTTIHYHPISLTQRLCSTITLFISEWSARIRPTVQHCWLLSTSISSPPHLIPEQPIITLISFIMQLLCISVGCSLYLSSKIPLLHAVSNFTQFLASSDAIKQSPEGMLAMSGFYPHEGTCRHRSRWAHLSSIRNFLFISYFTEPRAHLSLITEPLVQLSPITYHWTFGSPITEPLVHLSSFIEPMVHFPFPLLFWSRFC